MKLLLSITLICYVVLTPLISCANGYALFPMEVISRLELTNTDFDNATFVMKNQEGEKQVGSIGDFVGQGYLEVVEIGDLYILVEGVEVIVDQEGNEKEQKTRMRIPRSQYLSGKGVM